MAGLKGVGNREYIEEILGEIGEESRAPSLGSVKGAPAPVLKGSAVDTLLLARPRIQESSLRKSSLMGCSFHCHRKLCSSMKMIGDLQTPRCMKM
jgi:hypothetical protein